MLEIFNISKAYHKQQVLRDISLNILPGTLNAIVGENGAGKSTLLKIIVGEIKADTGSVKIFGKMGYCPQYPVVFPYLTVEENFYYFATAYGLKKRGMEKEWIQQRNLLMKQLSFHQYLHQRVDRLSGGTRQKLNVSVSLLHNPDIFILDEPYGGFDWETYQHFWEIIKDCKSKGKTILLVTHLLNNLQMFDNVFTLKEGRLL